MRSPWRVVLLLVALGMLVAGIATIATPFVDGGSVVSAAFGVPGVALGLFGAWRSLIVGVQYSPAGIVVRKVEHTSRFSWCDVAAVDTRLTPGDILVFLGQADIVLVLQSGDEEWLSPLAVYSFSSTVPKRVESKADALRAALDLHRAEHVDCARVAG